MFKPLKLINFVYSTHIEFKDFLFWSFRHLYIKIYLAACFGVNIFIWIITFYIDKKIAEEKIALHYNVDFGIDYYDDVEKIYILPLLGFLIIIINFLLTFFINQLKDKKFISYILFTGSLVVNIILLAAIISIYLINFK